MTIHTAPDGSLIVTTTSRVLDWILLGGAALCAIPAVRAALHGALTQHEATPLIGTVFFLFGFLVAYERTRFEFQPSSRSLRWSRTRLWSKRDGVLPFSRIWSVVLQTAIGSTTTSPDYRIAILTDEGELPLATGYAGGMGKEYGAIAARIRTVLGLSPSAPDIFLDSVRSALRQGRTVDAVRLVCHHKGMSLTEAKQFVETLPPASASSV